MDEPFGSLDAQTRGDMQELVLGLVAREGVTVIFVTHDVSEAILLGDRVLVMSARPGTISTSIGIDLPRPRRSDLVGSPGFETLRREVSRRLQAERAKAGS